MKKYRVGFMAEVVLRAEVPGVFDGHSGQTVELAATREQVIRTLIEAEIKQLGDEQSYAIQSIQDLGEVPEVTNVQGDESIQERDLDQQIDDNNPTKEVM